MDLNTARAIVRDAALHIRNSTFDDSKVDYAIMNAGHHFQRVTNAMMTTTDVSLSSGVKTVDLTSTITGFTENDFEFAEIDEQEVQHVPPQTVRRAFQGGSTPTGRPTRIGFVSDDKALFNKQTDQGYTLSVTHAKPFNSFTAGTASNPTLNLPNEYAHAVMWYGARYYLLHGAPGHPDSGPARDEFYRLLREAAAKYGRVSTGVLDASVPVSMSGRGAGQQQGSD